MTFVKFLGWINVLFLVLLILIFVLRFLSQKVMKQSPRFNQIVRFFSRIHMPVAALLITAGAVHGYMALYGQFILHTGTILYLMILLTVLSVIIGRALKIKKWLFLHKIFAFFSVVALMLHLFFQDLFS